MQYATKRSQFSLDISPKILANCGKPPAINHALPPSILSSGQQKRPRSRRVGDKCLPAEFSGCMLKNKATQIFHFKYRDTARPYEAYSLHKSSNRVSGEAISISRPKPKMTRYSSLELFSIQFLNVLILERRNSPLS